MHAVCAQKTRPFANENLIDKKHFKANPDVRLSLPFFVLAVGRFAYAAARSACKASVPTANVSTAPATLLDDPASDGAAGDPPLRRTFSGFT